MEFLPFARHRGILFLELAMKKQIEEMKREIERRGGIVVGLGQVPVDVAELFLKEVLTCPCCVATTRPKGESIDKILAGTHREESTH